jgi:uncharacterized protein YaiI (UPF0178 family)
MTVLIDADGCPVVDITVQVAKQAGVKCVIICDTSHVFERAGAKTVTVSQGNDSVDFALVNMIEKGDIAVTQYHGLAAMCLAMGGVPVNQNGLIYTESNIDELLMRRYAAGKIRLRGGRVKGPAKRTAEQDRIFEQTLRALIMAESSVADDTGVHSEYFHIG